MAIHQTKRESDLEKRLQLLHRQLYGRGSHTIKLDNQTSPKPHNISDVLLLKQELTKIALFATLAFGAQIIIFLILRTNILDFNLF